MFNEFSVNMPYPEVCGSIEAQTLASLMDVYGGRESETVAIFQYVYNSYILKEKFECYSKMFEEISMVEMKHHELLGTAIVTFGGDPIIAGRYAFFSGSYLSYIKNPKAMIKSAIEAELCAIDEYRRIIASTKNESLKDLISRIIMDEELHIAILTRAEVSISEE